MPYALSAVLALTVLNILCAASAVLCWRLSRTATKRVSTTSLLAELDEIRDAVARHSALLRKINARTVMAERRANGDAPEQLDSEAAKADWKRKMRARLIVPGRPVQHG